MPLFNFLRFRYGFQIIRVLPVLLLFLFLPGKLQTQTLSIHHQQFQFIFEDTLLKSPNYHSLFKPVEVSWKLYDTLMGVKHPPQNPNLRITPVMDAVFGYEKDGEQSLYHFAQGVYSSGVLGKKAGFEMAAVFNQQRFSSSYRIFLDSFSIIPGHNRALWNNQLNTGYLSLRGFVYWHPNRWLSFKVGNDKHFIGDGIRSLFLSENAPAAPFLQTRVNVWKLNYIHQVLFLRDVLPNAGSERNSKYVTMHTLSFNATPKLNFYIFEAVIWRAQDSARHRSFDVMYLNPFLFYRPAEFNIGSPDNVLMGLGGKWLIYKRAFLYGQLLLDEFHLKEIKANRGWWGIKYAVQAGFKVYGKLNNNPSYFGGEFNTCRPFTYSHNSPLQNYGYLLSPIAHPQGSNFREGIIQAGIRIEKWFVNSSISFIKYGTDSVNTNLGSDIYKPQMTFTKYYNNFTGQGIAHTSINCNLTLSRMLKPEWRLRAFVNFQANIHTANNKTELLPAISVGLNTWMYE